MNYSPESLQAFLYVVETGSFSAAARKLKKSQSTVSAAIANLEADLGLTLFDRHHRHPAITAHGLRILPCVKAIFAAREQLEELSIRLAGDTEPRLSFVLSDLWQTVHHESVLRQLSERYPDLEFECIIAEDDDVINSIQSGRAHVGVVRVQQHYPVDITAARLQIGTEMAIFIHKNHPVARQGKMDISALYSLRQLVLKTYVRPENALSAGPVWSSPSLLMLLEMAEQGFGWGILPRWLVSQFGHQVLTELNVEGWPRHFDVDVVWSNKIPPGPAGRWLIDELRARK